MRQKDRDICSVNPLIEFLNTIFYNDPNRLIEVTGLNMNFHILVYDMDSIENYLFELVRSAVLFVVELNPRSVMR